MVTRKKGEEGQTERQALTGTHHRIYNATNSDLLYITGTLLSTLLMAYAAKNLKKRKKQTKNRSRVTGRKQTNYGYQGWGRINWETGMGIHIPLYIKEIIDKHPLICIAQELYSIHYHGLYEKKFFKKTGCICTYIYIYIYTHTYI